jgi:IS5 family transposase
MIEMRRTQLSFGDGLIAEEVSDLREDWMPHADEVLADEDVVMVVYEALAKRRPKSRSRGRRGTPADVVLRLLTLKHIRNWSYEELEREVRANLVYRDFTHVGGGKMPDAKTMGRWGVALGPQVLKQIHERMVRIAQAKGVTTGRRMRVDTTVVETNVHPLPARPRRRRPRPPGRPLDLRLPRPQTQQHWLRRVHFHFDDLGE